VHFREIRLSRPVLRAQGHFTPYTDLEKYNRELADLDELLESERNFNKVKEQEFTKRWDLAYERQQLLNVALEKFSEYYEVITKCYSRLHIQQEKILNDSFWFKKQYHNQ